MQSSVMTCLTALPLLFLLLSFIFVQSTLSLDFKGGNSKTYSQCEKCKIVVDSFKEVSVELHLFSSFINLSFSGPQTDCKR